MNGTIPLFLNKNTDFEGHCHGIRILSYKSDIRKLSQFATLLISEKCFPGIHNLKKYLKSFSLLNSYILLNIFVLKTY